MAAKRFFSFSIRQLLAWTAVVALGCVALRSASAIWVSALLGVVLLLLTASLPLAIFRQNSERAYWSGFALFGWLYMLLLAYGWSLDPNTSQSNPLRPYSLVTAQLSSSGYNRIYATTPNTRILPLVGPVSISHFGNSMGAYTGNTVPAFNGPSHDDFVNVAHAFWAILLAACGGWFTCWLYASRPATQDSKSGATV